MCLRHQDGYGVSASIESIISYAFLVIPFLPMKKREMDDRILKAIPEKKDTHPLVVRLDELGRFARFFNSAGMNTVITEMSVHESSQLSVGKNDYGGQYT